VIPPLLYIDPGTGSMLFSILIGAAATLYFLARTFLIKLKVILSGGVSPRNKTDYPCVVYSEGVQYWNVFKPLLDEFEKRGIPLVYYTSAKNDPVFSRGYGFIKAEFIGEGNMAFARLNFLSATLLVMTTPGLDVYQLKRSKNVGHYTHILHMPGDSATYRLFSLDYFDSVLLTGDYQAKDIRFLEALRNTKKKELVTVGCTYLDVYSEKIKDLHDSAPAASREKKCTVLVSPSWGASGLLQRYGEKLLDPLVKTGKNVIIRPHPQSKKSESEMLNRLTERYGNCHSVEWDFEGENIRSLSRSDIMISDFSGIIFDYLFLCDKPVIYAGADMDLRSYDASDLDHELWQTKTLREIGIELREDDFSRIGEIIDRAVKSVSLKEARQRAKQTAWQYPGEAGKRAADFIVSKLVDIKSESG
jgi:hypothetical protein